MLSGILIALLRVNFFVFGIFARFLSWFSSGKAYSKNSTDLREKVIQSVDVSGLGNAHGYRISDHVVQTQDGYLLTVHRVHKEKCVAKGKPAVYFHHGLMTNSELFITGDSKEKCLPFVLVDNGYDVWLGNNRGNKYSCKHINISSADERFWDFSIDQLAMFDIPATIDYVLEASANTSLTYVGFSQGFAQGLASLSINPELNKKINKVIGLSPVMIPRLLSHNLVMSWVIGSPSILYKLFGKRAILPSVHLWQQVFGLEMYGKIVSYSLKWIFRWYGNNVSHSQKAFGYPHLFSNASVKTVVHWFQIIDRQRFQMFDDCYHCHESLPKSLLSRTTTFRKHSVTPFPLNNVTTKFLLIYGDADVLVDGDKMRASLYKGAMKQVVVPGYEHMDTLWGTDVKERVFDCVLKELAQQDLNESSSDDGFVKERILDTSVCPSVE